MSDKIIKYDDIVVYENGAWVDPAFRDIEITGGEDTTDTALISTLSANSTITPIEPDTPDTPDVPVEPDTPVLELAPFLTNIANAIRTKKGTTGIINAQNFASEIESIEGGGSSNWTEETEFTGTINCVSGWATAYIYYFHYTSDVFAHLFKETINEEGTTSITTNMICVETEYAMAGATGISNLVNVEILYGAPDGLSYVLKPIAENWSFDLKLES